MSNETVRLTYSELAKARGITLAAARRMTLRHKWPKQVGNDGLTRVSVPASALIRSERGTGNGTGDAPGAVRHAGNGAVNGAVPGDGTGKEANGALALMSAPALVLVQPDNDGAGAGTGDGTADVGHAGTGVLPGTGNGDVAAALQSLGDAVASLSEQLIRERDRAGRAEIRVQEAESRAADAESRAAEYQQQLQAEMVEHRRIVGMLTEQLSARQSWWPWRRRG
jgi:hypothetical protein